MSAGYRRPTSARTALACATLLLAVGVCACASGGPQKSEAPANVRTVTLLVENSSSDNLTVYLVRGGSRQRLGMAGSSSTTPFFILDQWLGTGQVDLVAEPRGPLAQERWIENLDLLPGDLVRWSITHHQTSYLVRHR